MQVRGPPLKLGRSGVHAWGLFADAQIGPEEFVAEYTGELIRASVNAARERFESESDYRFRVDGEWVVDATRKVPVFHVCTVSMTHCRLVQGTICFAESCQIQGQGQTLMAEPAGGSASSLRSLQDRVVCKSRPLACKFAGV